jgi:hypothetical protein
MNKKSLLKVLLAAVSLMLLIKLLTAGFGEKWLGEKIQKDLDEKIRNYTVKIEKVHISLMRSGIELGNITISSKKENTTNSTLEGKIASIRFRGINLISAIFKKDIGINELIISNCRLKGRIPLPGEAVSTVIALFNIRIRRLIFDKTDLMIESTKTAQSFSVTGGNLKVYDFKVGKQDTLIMSLVKQFDFEAEELASISADSMYSFNARHTTYSGSSNILSAESFSIHPNYKDYDFTSRYEFQTNCFEAVISSIYFHGFNAADYFTAKSLVSTNIEIGKMDLKVFRDKRKEFRHVNKPAFQDMIYNYPGHIKIDSVSLTNGNVVFTVQAEKANEPGSISFIDINAKIFKLSNDPVYKKEKGILKLQAEALFMGKSMLTILLNGKIFDTENTFSVKGNLAEMEAKELNPILEKNAFIYATSGKIDGMTFNFSATNTNATGRMTLLYHGLDITVKNKSTDDTTAFRERFVSFLANLKMIDSNPMPGKEVREGVIEYERDPERFLFHYCFRSILSGMESSLMKNPKKRKNP